MKNLEKLFEPVYGSREIGEIERLAPYPLMERAGLAVAELAMSLGTGNRMLVLAGPGNNGGDAFVAARQLKSWGMAVELVFLGEEEKLPGDAAAAYRAWIDSGGSCRDAIPEGGKWHLVIDGLFGTGLSRPISGNCGKIIESIASLRVLSIDMPSGISSDTGNALGIAVKADHTLTFIALKPGLLTSDGLDHCGKLHLERLGLDPLSLKPPSGWLSNREILPSSFRNRPRNSHKGLFGSTAVIGGAIGMMGAALLAARAALNMGSGKVFLGMQGDFGVDLLQPEIMVRSPDRLMDSSSIVIGPGLGQSDWASSILEAALGSGSPLVIDADALNLISMDERLRSMLSSRKGSAILTPHPAEAARLLGCTTARIQEDRIASAKHLSEVFNCPVVLKGAGSVCAFPDGKWVINSSGNPGLAQAGMGDVLSGMIGAFLSQGLGAEEALLCAVYLHGAAADSLVEAGIGPVGLTASELIIEARRILNRG